MALGACWPAGYYLSSILQDYSKWIIWNCYAVFSLVLSTYLCIAPAYLRTYVPMYLHIYNYNVRFITLLEQSHIYICVCDSQTQICDLCFVTFVIVLVALTISN